MSSAEPTPAQKRIANAPPPVKVASMAVARQRKAAIDAKIAEALAKKK